MEHALRTLLVLAPTPPPWAGPEIVTQQLLDDGILQKRFKVHHLRSTIHTTNTHKGHLRVASVLRLAWLWLAALWQIIYYRPAVIYTHLSQNFSGFLRDACFIWQARMLGRKVVLHFHGGDFQGFFRSQSRWVQYVITHTLRQVERVIVLGETLKAQFANLVPDRHLEVLYNGVSIPNRSRSQAQSAQVAVLYLGSISTSKGCHLLVDAATTLLNTCPETHIELTGEVIPSERNITHTPEGRALPTFSEVITHQPTNLTIHQPVSGPEKEALFLRSDIFVLPSYSEGLPLSVLEAMSYGLALIVTPVGALPEILKDGVHCLFVPVGSVSALSSALERLVREPNLRMAMGKANRALIESQFGSAKIAQNLASIFDRIIEGKA